MFIFFFLNSISRTFSRISRLVLLMDGGWRKRWEGSAGTKTGGEILLQIVSKMDDSKNRVTVPSVLSFTVYFSTS